MTAEQRRKELLELLSLDIKPVSASKLAERFDVSRQIIVGDIALLRASGTNITATPRGYVLEKDSDTDTAASDSYVIATSHNKHGLARELYTIVDNGGSLLSISVEHPVYGTISHELVINNRYEADSFIKQINESNAALLCDLTGGVHLHTLKCPDAEAYRRILVELKKHGLLYTK